MLDILLYEHQEYFLFSLMVSSSQCHQRRLMLSWEQEDRLSVRQGALWCVQGVCLFVCFLFVEGLCFGRCHFSWKVTNCAALLLRAMFTLN